MKYRDYAKSIEAVRVSDELEFKMAIMCLQPSRAPIGLVSIGSAGPVVKVPGRAMNKYGQMSQVIAIAQTAFEGNKDVTDIVLPSGILKLPSKAFAGCENLRNITIPQSLQTIKEGTFEGCRNLENIYYEGTRDDWKKVEIVHQKHEIELGRQIPGRPTREVLGERMIHIPGNEAVFTANIHFRCDLDQERKKVNE